MRRQLTNQFFPYGVQPWAAAMLEEIDAFIASRVAEGGIETDF